MIFLLYRLNWRCYTHYMWVFNLGFYRYHTPNTYNLCVVAFWLFVASILRYVVLLLAQAIQSSTNVFAALGVREKGLQVCIVSAAVTLVTVLGIMLVEFVLRRRKEKAWWAKFRVVSSLVKQAVQRRLDMGQGNVEGWGQSCSEQMRANVDLRDWNSCAFYIVEDLEKLMPIDELENTEVGRSRMRALIDSALDAGGDDVDNQIDRLQKQHGYANKERSAVWQTSRDR